jgi:hypothetical protein
MCRLIFCGFVHFEKHVDVLVGSESSFVLDYTDIVYYCLSAMIVGVCELIG